MKRNNFLLCLLIPWLALTFTGCDSSSDSGGPTGPLTVLAMGDSNTGAVIYPGVAPWPAVLAGIEPEWTMVNSGIRGERSSGGRSRLPGRLSATKPDVVVIMYGANNAIMGDMSGFAGDIRAMVQLCKARGARVVLGNVLPMVGARSIFNGRVNALNQQLAAIAQEEAVVLVDLNREFRGDTAAERLPDGLHPDADGIRIIAVAMREGIRKAVR